MEIRISEIKTEEQLKNWLDGAMKENGGNEIFWMDDHYTNRPTLRVMESWERHERMSYTFRHIEDDVFEYSTGKVVRGVENMANSLYSSILEKY